MKKLNGQPHKQVSVESVRPGDYIEFFQKGYRVRKVAAVHLGRKHQYVRLEPLKSGVFILRTLPLNLIQNVWRLCNECSGSSGEAVCSSEPRGPRRAAARAQETHRASDGASAEAKRVPGAV